MSKEELIKKIMNCCFADDSGNFWEKFRNWESGQSFYTSDIDPDQQSKKLYKVHELLWNKQELKQVKVIWNRYAYELIGINDKEFRLGSDSIMSIYWHWAGKNYPYKKMREIIDAIGSDITSTSAYKNLCNEIKEKFSNQAEQRYEPNEDSLKKFIWCYLQKANTIGGFMVFPRHRNYTINTARGSKTSKIQDRFDLTLECIRRFYATHPKNKEVSRDDYADNPLFCSLNKNYWKKDMEFFKSFASFEEYIDFFCLDSWVIKDKNNKYLVKNLLSDENVQTLDNWDFNQQEPLPQNAVEWWQLYTNIMSRLDERNKKIEDLLEDKLLQKRRPAS